MEDGYSVNQDGAWVVDGVVQTKPETASEGEYISLEVVIMQKSPQEWNGYITISWITIKGHPPVLRMQEEHV